MGQCNHSAEQIATFAQCIYRNIPAALSSIPFHKDSPFIQRFVPEGFPLHMAVHRISNAEGHPNKYVALHAHREPEINILIADEGVLEYEVQLGEEIHRVTSPATIWIPPEVPHAANVVRGSGYYVCMILASTARAFDGADRPVQSDDGLMTIASI